MTSVKYPVSVVLELTYRCNHKCKFCSCPWENPYKSFKQGIELSTKEWFDAIDKLYSIGVESFSLSGGEATLRTDITEIIEHIRQEGHKRNLNSPIVLISNGKNMTEELLDVFVTNDVHLSMSLPGYKTFTWHTGVDNAENVLTWFRKAKEKGLHTTAGITITKMNYDELYETIARALINGAEQILLNRFLPGGRGLEYKNDLELNRTQLQGMLKTAEQVLRKAKRYGSVGTEYPHCLIPDDIDLKYLRVGSMCAAATGFFVVGPSGEIRVCNHSPKVIGNIKDEEIVTDSEYWNIFAMRNYLPYECQGCKLNNVCACGCREVAHIMTGSTRSKDPCLN